jgi:serine/threonine-protein kinase
VGGAAALAAVVVVALIASNGGEDSDTASEQSSTTAAQVPAGPITTVASEPAAPEAPGAPAPAPAPSGPTLGADALPGLLLSPEQVGQRLNTPGMTGTAIVSSPLDGTITPPHCASAWGPAGAASYGGSGYTGLAVQVVSAEPAPQVAQAVAAFPDPGAAKGFFDKQSAAWSSCQSTHMTWSYAGDSAEVDVGVPAMIGDIMTLKLVSTTSSVAGQQCERDMTVRGNVIVDVRACSPTIGSGGLSIASDIASKIR